MASVRVELTTVAVFAGLLVSAVAQTRTPAPPRSPADALIDKLVEKGILTEKEARELLVEAARPKTDGGTVPTWQIRDAFRNITLFGDIRFRFEYRAADNTNPSALGASGSDYYRERFRYSVRIGLKGDLFEDFYYGLRLETSSNPRSPWVTFGDDSNPSPSAKNSDGINLGQLYLGWKAADWYEMTVGKLANPLYTTPMVWDADINPEGVAEKLKAVIGKFEAFATFGQFMYQDTNPDAAIPSSDTFLLAWQLGANAKVAKNIEVKAAPVLYTYTGRGAGNNTSALLYYPYTGQGYLGVNWGGNGYPTNTANAIRYNQNGINDLLIIEVPAEANFKIGPYGGRVFGDWAHNILGDDRARAAALALPSQLPRAITGQDNAYQVGVAIGKLGLVYGTIAKKNTWEARTYWQHVEQYALDVNLMDSDLFEGRGNLEGVGAAFAFSLTDSLIARIRYGCARRIRAELGTGGNNPSLEEINPIKNYHLLQVDLTSRF